MTQQLDVPMELVANEESRLWTAYMVAEARKVECERLYHETWRAFTLTGLKDSVRGQVNIEVSKMWDAARKNAEVAYQAWKRVAYPLHNIPFNDEDGSVGTVTE